MSYHPEAINRRSVALMVELRDYLNEAGIDRKDEYAQRRGVESWLIQKIAGLQLLVSGQPDGFPDDPPVAESKKRLLDPSTS